MNFKAQKIELTRIISDLREQDEHYEADKIHDIIGRAMTASKTDMGHAHGILDRLLKSDYLKELVERDEQNE